MKTLLFDALEDCLQAIEKGETIETVLARYPHLTEDLRPMLESAQAIKAQGRRNLPVQAAARSRARVMAAASKLSSAGAERHNLKIPWRFMLITLAILAFLVVGGNGFLVASAHSLPGDVLYPIKRSAEITQLILTSNPAHKIALLKEFSQRRLQETQSLITIGRVVQVEFDGVVTSKIKNGWVVNGIPVVVTSHTHLVSDVQVGDDINVSGETHQDGSVEASSLERKPRDDEHPFSLTSSPTGSNNQFDSSATPATPTAGQDNPPGSNTPGIKTTTPSDEPAKTQGYYGTPEPSSSPGYDSDEDYTPGEDDSADNTKEWQQTRSTDGNPDNPPQSTHTPVPTDNNDD